MESPPLIMEKFLSLLDRVLSPLVGGVGPTHESHTRTYRLYFCERARGLYPKDPIIFCILQLIEIDQMV